MLKHVASTVLMDNLRAKYHIMETTFSILQLFDCITDITEDCTAVVAMNLCHKFFDKTFKVHFRFIMTRTQNIIQYGSTAY